MARQLGANKNTGFIDGIIYYEMEGDYFARSSSAPSRRQVLRDKRFKRTRENAREFGRASEAATLVKRSIPVLLYRVCDNRVSSRLTGLFRKIINFDTKSKRGRRKPGIALEGAEARAMLRGFEFNKNGLVRTLLKSTCVIEEDALRIRNFIPKRDLNYPEGATHACFKGACSIIDFGEMKSATYYSEELVFAIDETMVNAELMLPMTETIGVVRFYFLRIDFLQELNGEMYVVNDRRFNGLFIAEVF